MDEVFIARGSSPALHGGIDVLAQILRFDKLGTVEHPKEYTFFLVAQN